MACGSKGFTRPVQGTIRPQNASHKAANAVDIEAPDGTPVFAAVTGRVVAAIGNQPDTRSEQRFVAGPFGRGRYGNFVVITGEDGCSYLTAHMSATYVTVGSHVQQGELVGRVGRSGHATGPHCHFAVLGATDVLELLDHPQVGEGVKGAPTTVGGKTGTSVGDFHLGPLPIPGTAPVNDLIHAVPQYLKIAAGGFVLLIALVLILAAIGLSSGAASGALEGVPVLGGAVRGVKRKRAAAAATSAENLRLQRMAERESVKTQAASERAYQTARARRLAKEGLTQTGEVDAA